MSRSDLSAQIKSVADELGANPLFQLSTANQELFHSNMLFWLATTAADQSQRVWQALTGEKQTPPIAAVHRERANLDLIVSFADGSSLVIENKIHSIAQEAQLTAYQARLPSVLPESAGPVRLRLLSLFPPAIDLPEGWVTATYESLVEPLGSVVDALRESGGEADAAVVSRYRHVVSSLLTLRDLIDPLACPDSPFALPSSLDDQFAVLRLLPLVRKSQAARIIERLTSLLGSEVNDRRHALKAGMSNATGLMEHLITIRTGPNRDRRFGWQVQGDQFRLVVISRDRDRTKAVDPDNSEESPLARCFAGYINPVELTIRGVELQNPARKTWCRYGDGFVYQYGRLPADTTTSELLDLCLRMSRRAISMIPDFED